MKPNIYYGGAISEADADSKRIAKLTITALQKHGKVLTEHLSYDDPRAWDTENMKNGANICERDTAWQNDSDVVVLDISKASTGTGDENMYNIGVRGNPVLALYRDGVRASPMVTQRKHPLLKVESYASDGELEQKIDAFMTAYKREFTVYPNLLVYDAIDGAGKGAIGEAFKELASAKGRRIFDCVDYWKIENRIPTWADVKTIVPDCNMVMTAEPTYAGMGKIIREEIIRKGHPRPYSALSTAFAYSLDREILFKTLLTDALNEGALVGSDRGRVTSEHYQPLQAEQFEGYNREYFLGVVRGLPGNQHSFKHVPGLLIIPQVDAAVAQARLAARTEKNDNVRFEVASFQEELAKIYAGHRITKAYERRGTQVVDLLMNKCPTRDDSKREATSILETYLREKNITI